MPTLTEHKGSMIGQRMKEHGEDTARVDGCQSTKEMSKQIRVSVV